MRSLCCARTATGEFQRARSNAEHYKVDPAMPTESHASTIDCVSSLGIPTPT